MRLGIGLQIDLSRVIAAVLSLPLDNLNAAAAYSLRRLRTAYTGPLARVRRSDTNAEADIGFGADGWLDLDALTLHCGAPRRPLDAVTGSAAAYSTRLVRTAYTGPCMRVRRDSDNAEQNIGFTASGDLDTVALLAFTGAGSGFVTTWYDQSGSGRHATQGTAANQPRIVNAGVVQTLNGRPTLDQVTTSVRLNIPAFSGMTSAIVSAVYAQAAINNGFAPWQLNQLDHLPWTNTLAYAGPFSATRPQFSGWSAAANELIVASAVQTGTALAVYRNGTQNGTTQASAFALPSSQGNRTVFGGLNGSGFVSELIVLSAWDGGPVNRQTLERSQAAYFGVAHVDPISGFVTTWYDQSGNGRNVSQATAANQPRIVNAGVVFVENGRPSIEYLGSQSLRFTSATNVFVGSIGAASVFALDAGTNARIISLVGATGLDWNTAGSAAFTRSGSAGAVGITSAGPQRSIQSYAIGTLTQASVTLGTSFTIWLNGTVGTTSSGPALNARTLTIGANGANEEPLTGAVSEVILLASAPPTTDRQALERNQGAAFGITVA